MTKEINIMSNALGQARFSDGTIMYFKYYGTSDIADSALYDTVQSAMDDRYDRDYKSCTCCREPEEVELVTDYGQGIGWESMACKSCHAIVGEVDPYEVEITGGLPDWWVKPKR